MVVTYTEFSLKLEEVDTVGGQKTLGKSLFRQYKNKIESYSNHWEEFVPRKKSVGLFLKSVFQYEVVLCFHPPN